MLGILEDPAGQFAIPSSLLLKQCPTPQLKLTLKTFTEKSIGKKDSLYQTFAKLYGQTELGLAKTMAEQLWNDVSHSYQAQDIEIILYSFQLSRERLALEERDIAILKAHAHLYARELISAAEWERFYVYFVWNQGKCTKLLHNKYSRHKLMPVAEAVLNQVAESCLENHETFMSRAGQFVARFAGEAGEIARVITEAISSGARWFEPYDLPRSRVFKDRPDSPASLMLGRAPDGTMYFYDGDASLITIGSPGTGKSLSQVMPNLFMYPGSAFVLDVKGELWDATAAHRQKYFGPVYRFSPSLPHSHCYNPFDAISSTDPSQAATDCHTFARSLMPMGSKEDQYWDKRGKVYLTGFAMVVALDCPPEQRNIAELSRLMIFRTDFEGREEAIKNHATDLLLKRMTRVAGKFGLPALANTAQQIRDELTSSGTRLASIIDTARGAVEALAMTPRAYAAISRSDWKPQDLRAQTGTTVYLCFKPGADLQANAPLIRLLIQQHAQALLQDFSQKKNEPPITFFLDELPQLGFMETLNDLLDVGRGAGVRLWMLAQTMGQLKEIYGSRAEGLVGAPQIRCFMQPDTDAARFIQPLMGKTKNFISGKEQELAELHELSGRKYGDRIICIPRNEHPILFHPAWVSNEFPQLMGQAPLAVPRSMPEIPAAPEPFQP